jgi:DNA-binding SARP family transcriptional activator
MTTQVGIRLMGRFEVEVDGDVVDDGVFERRHAASLVKLLALSGRRLHREQVIDALWPELTVDEAAPRLHKAASYARKAVGDKEAVVMRDDTVLLWPDAEPVIDVEQFELAADLAGSGSVDEAGAAADLYRGELLPDDPYEDWVGERRDQLRLRHLDALRIAGRWESVLEAEPADEEAHLALMRRFLAEGQRLSCVRQYERLERALSEELGVSPGDEAVALRSQIFEDAVEQVELVDRGEERELMRRALDDAERGSGSLLLLTGVPGIGKTALSEWLIDRAGRHGFLIGRGIAASVDGPWPYAPVLEAIDDLVRQAPELLDDLPETYRDELMRVRGAPGTPHERPDDADGHQRLFVAVDRLIGLASESHGLVLFIDDLHVADDASLTLLHYIARQADRSRLLLVATARSGIEAGGLVALRGLVGRHGAREVRVGPFGADHAMELVRARSDNGPTDSALREIVALSGGTPFYLEELARSLEGGTTGPMPDQLAAIVTASFSDLPSDLREALARVAIAGNRIDTDQFIALTGVDEAAAFDLLDQALAREILEHTAGGYQFRHGLMRDSLLEELAPHRRRQVHRDAADRFQAMGAPPARIAHHLIEAQAYAEAAPWALKAARAALAVGALSDALNVIDAVLDRSEAPVRLELLAVRADVLAGLSDPGAIPAYQQALAETQGPVRRLLRAKMARAALMGGAVDVAQAALEGLEPDGGPYDAPVLHAQGMLAYFTGDLEAAAEAAEAARGFALSDGAPARLLDVLTLQGMVAHNRGEWMDRMRGELAAAADSPELATTVFDSHL